MLLAMLLDKQGLSAHQCSKMSDIPYTTLLELIKGKTSIEKCSAETLYKLAKTLGVSMEHLFEQAAVPSKRVAFETFKSNLCHMVKEKGDAQFIIDSLTNDDVNRYWDRQWYPEAYYVLAMLDYLCRVNDLPICENYNSIRATALKKTIFPRDIALAARIDPALDVRSEAIKESIPEFIRFNIVEKEIRNVC